MHILFSYQTYTKGRLVSSSNATLGHILAFNNNLKSPHITYILTYVFGHFYYISNLQLLNTNFCTNFCTNRIYWIQVNPLCRYMNFSRSSSFKTVCMHLWDTSYLVTFWTTKLFKLFSFFFFVKNVANTILLFRKIQCLD